MTRPSPAALAAARRLWASGANDAATPDDVGAVASRIFAQLGRGLARWIGPDGYTALLNRALGLARQEHGALLGLMWRESAAPDFAAAAQVYGVAAVRAGVVAMLATFIDLLARIIGEDMAVQLVERTRPLSGPGAPESDTVGGRDA
ncbi:MAG TPA: hypothetical protein VFW66_04430 [Gemmatimonadales bacterium]|nr:hypothetical protein [Gemmatimonadales bacterium]